MTSQILQLIDEYCAHRLEVDQKNDNTVENERGRLMHLVYWLGGEDILEAPNMKPVFAEYLKGARRDDRDRPLSAEYSRKVVSTVKRFLRWLRDYHDECQPLRPIWIESLRPPRQTTETPKPKAVPHEQMIEIAEAPVEGLREMRIQAAACFMYASAIRVGALVSIRLRSIDLDARTIMQLPSLGTQTKNSKAAITYLLNDEVILKPVYEWDRAAREVLPEDAYWFAPLSPLHGGIDTSCPVIGKHRTHAVRKDLTQWLKKNGFPHLTPHQFRHGFGVYGLTQSKDMADVKAVSLNMMHENISTTEGIYGVLAASDVSQRIGALGNTGTAKEDNNYDLVMNKLELIERKIDRLIDRTK